MTGKINKDATKESKSSRYKVNFNMQTTRCETNVPERKVDIGCNDSSDICTSSVQFLIKLCKYD